MVQGLPSVRQGKSRQARSPSLCLLTPVPSPLSSSRAPFQEPFKPSQWSRRPPIRARSPATFRSSREAQPLQPPALDHAAQDARDPMARHPAHLLVRRPALPPDAAQETPQSAEFIDDSRKGEGEGDVARCEQGLQARDRGGRQPRPSELPLLPFVCSSFLQLTPALSLPS